MSQLQSLAPWALVLIAIWFIIWGVRKLFAPANPIVEGILAILAIVAGVLLLITH